MKKFYTLILFCAFSSVLLAQAKKTPVKKVSTAKTTTVAAEVDSSEFKEVDPPIPQEFAVYTIRYKHKMPKLKLCLNLVENGVVCNYCMNDSLVRDPEKKKVLFQKVDGDSVYSLVYVSAFTKDPALPQCNAGRETKLYFVRWSLSTQKAIVRYRYIESCYKTFTRLGEEPIVEWAGTEPLKITYNRGSVFIDLEFDPANYKLGIQSAKE